MTNVVVPLTQGSHWALGLTLNDRGVPFGNLRNVLFALRNAPEWQGVLAYDAFAARVITQKPPPWGNRTVEEWVDEHDTRACEWIQEQGVPAAPGVVGRAVQTVAREPRPPRSRLPARLELGRHATARYVAHPLSRRRR
jgi:hypothetical protein